MIDKGVAESRERLMMTADVDDRPTSAWREVSLKRTPYQECASHQPDYDKGDLLRQGTSGYSTQVAADVRMKGN